MSKKLLTTLSLLVCSFALVLSASAITPAETLDIYTIDNLIIAPQDSTGVAKTNSSIDLEFSGPVSVSLDILNSGGTLEKHLYNSASVTNPDPKVWDGKNSFSNFVDDGTYTVQVVYTSSGITATDTSKTILVDNTEPAVGVITITPSYNDGGTTYVASTSEISAPVSDSGSGIDGTSCLYNVSNGSSSATKVPTAYDSVLGKCVFTGIDTTTASGIAVSVLDLAGNQFNTSSSWISVTPDLTAPVTTATALSAGGNYVFGEKATGPVEITLASNDIGSGVSQTYYSVDDGATYSVYSAPFALSAVGTYSVKFYSVDRLGNFEASQSKTVIIETPSSHRGGQGYVMGWGLNGRIGDMGKVLGTSTEKIAKEIIKIKLTPEEEKARELRGKLNRLKIALYDLKHPKPQALDVPTDPALSSVSNPADALATGTKATSTPKKPFWKFW